jgi:hypothetical protein
VPVPLIPATDAEGDAEQELTRLRQWVREEEEREAGYTQSDWERQAEADREHEARRAAREAKKAVPQSLRDAGKEYRRRRRAIRGPAPFRRYQYSALRMRYVRVKTARELAADYAEWLAEEEEDARQWTEDLATKQASFDAWVRDDMAKPQASATQFFAQRCPPNCPGYDKKTCHGAFSEYQALALRSELLREAQEADDEPLIETSKRATHIASLERWLRSKHGGRLC